MNELIKFYTFLYMASSLRGTCHVHKTNKLKPNHNSFSIGNKLCLFNILLKRWNKLVLI